MNDTNQSQPNLPGFEEYPDMKHNLLPDFGQIIQKNVDKGTFDPHSLMVKKKEINSGEIADNISVKKWPEKDIKSLEDFCKKHGIVGFDCGLMSPVAALAMIKQRLGVVDGSLEERVPYGYKKMNINSNTTNTNEKVLLNG